MSDISNGKLSAHRKWFTDNWAEGIRFSVRVREVLHEVRSPFQHILVLETIELGRMLVLDGNIQCSEADEAGYHEMIVHPGLCRIGASTSTGKRVLIIGGGDGGAAREALRHNDVVRVDLVDIDPEVTSAAQRFLSKIWLCPDERTPLHEDPRLSIRNEDGLAFLESKQGQPDESYDLVVVDATDPIGPGAVLFSDRFYGLLRSVTKESGAVSVQAGSWWYLPDVLRTALLGLRRAFGRAEPYSCWSTVYPGGLWNLVIATREDDPSVVNRERADSLHGCRFYSSDVHRASFVLGPQARSIIGI